MNEGPVSSSLPPSPPGEKPGYKLGPMTFVPELGTTGKTDPWAHRKGEPRLFALLWAVYLMVGSLLTIFSVRSIGITRLEPFRVASLGLLTVVGVGIAVVWPLVRLSQERPRRPIRSVLLDAAVVLAPVQAVVWPMPLLTGWPLSVAGAIALGMAGWTLLLCGVIATGVAAESGWRRTSAMATALFVCCAAPVAWAAGTWLPGVQVGPPRELLLLSPLTLSVELTRTEPGLLPVVSRWGWLAMLATVFAGMLSLLLAATPTKPSVSERAGGARGGG